MATMSLPTAAQQALVWQAYGSDATNLVCPIVCDFTTFSQYTFNPSGNFRNAGQVFAAGLVVDNLLNSGPLIVTIGPITETIPPYTKQSLTLAGSATQVTVAGVQARIIVTFYKGTYLGTTSGTNFYQAQLAAGLAVETGFISMFAGSTAGIPVGYLLCDGSPVSRTTYAGLYAVIGTLYGPGDGSTTFNLPDLTSRVAIGAGTGSGLTTRGLGSKGGQEQITITAAMMPYHTHPVVDNGHGHGATDPGHTHPMNDPGHGHGISDPGHGHGTNDPGHTHPFQFSNVNTNAPVDTNGRIISDAGGAPNTWSIANTGNWFFAGRPNNWDAVEPYSVTIKSAATGQTVTAAQTGVSVIAAQTGVTPKPAATGVTVQSATTGITVGYAGGQGGVTQATPTVPPYTGVNFVIKT